MSYYSKPTWEKRLMDKTVSQMRPIPNISLVSAQVSVTMLGIRLGVAPSDPYIAGSTA